MDWRVTFLTFGLVFLAELGDKTQLMVFAQTTKTGAPLAVFLGAAGALVASTLLGVLVGGAMGKLPPWILKGAAGTMFIGFGVWTFIELFSKKA